MVNAEDDYNPELSSWLEDSARRQVTNLIESPETLLKFMEEVSGRRLTSRQDILDYLRALKDDEDGRGHAATRRRIVRETIFLGLLAVAAVQYYMWDVYLQIGALQKTHYFVPPGPSKRAI